ncbi:MAG: hypothetical protein HYT65_01065 [Candidatus Yanofskybacteria bacterium]|nr:hypothetical protein [Candidatus Yanofskybacteria bacterium]
MSRIHFFIIGAAVIFVLERVLPVLTSWPLFIFTFFVILFMLSSENEVRDLSYITVTAVFFDIFSGFHLGFFIISLLAICLLIHLFKNRVKVEAESFFLMFIYSLIFILGFITLMSVWSSSVPSISRWPIIISESVIIFIVFSISNHYLANARHK